MGEIIILLSDYCELRRRGGRIYIKNRKTECSYPVHLIDSILIYGKTTITSDVLDLCVENGISVVLMSQSGRVRGTLHNFLNSSGVRLRLMQYDLQRSFRIPVARLIVEEKLSEIEKIYGVDLNLLKRRLEKARTLQELLQIEALGSRYMFRNFAEVVNNCGFNFRGRSYSPPQDEVNALLSFVYTLGHTLVLAYLLARGYDPHISYLHRKKGEHASFASDIQEVIRPHLTKFVEKLIVEEKIVPDDFEKTDSGSFYIKRNKIEVIITAFSQLTDEYISRVRKVLDNIYEFYKSKQGRREREEKGLDKTAEEVEGENVCDIL